MTRDFCRAILQAEGLPFWNNIAFFDETLKLCLSQLENPDQTLADAFASTLGDLTFASESDSSSQAVSIHFSTQRFEHGYHLQIFLSTIYNDFLQG